MNNATTTATGTYFLFDNQIHEEFNFNEQMFCTTLKAVDDRPACSTSAAASTDFRSVLESVRQAYSLPEITSDLTVVSTEHGHTPDTGWMPFKLWFVEPKDLQPLATLKDETIQEFPKMRSPFESSIDDDILDSSSTMEIAPSEEREHKEQQSRRRQQSGRLRIKPQSEAHAYQLHRNRVAATTYRVRKKEEMEKAQHNFTEAEKTNRMLQSTLKRLHNEAMDLQKELLKHCNCVCQKIDCPVWVRISESYSDGRLKWIKPINSLPGAYI